MAFVIADRVKETSTTTGTGALTLAAAATGFRRLSAVPSIAVGDTLFYTIEAVDASGLPSGDWEVGLGTYSASNELTRTTVLASSNAGAAVNLAAGTKNVFVTVPATQAAWIRERLTAARTYYVRTDGADTNTGLANTAGGAFLTIQKLVDTICALDMGPYQVTGNVADGTYTGAVTFYPYLGNLAPIIQGNTTTPANCVVSTTSVACFTASNAGRWVVKGFKTTTTTSGALFTVSFSSIILLYNMDFGATSGGSSQIQVARGGVVTMETNMTISGGAGAHIFALGGRAVCQSKTITITGTPAFASAFVLCDRTPGALELDGNTYSGSATGKRYDIRMNSAVYVNGAASTYFPGDVAGTTASGGQYA